LALIFFLLALLLQGCARAPAARQTELPELGKLKVGYVPVISPVYVSYEKGYFKEQGLDVELVPFDSGAKMVAALSAGQLDVGNGEVGPALLNALNQQFDIKIVMGAGSMPKGYGPNPFLVRKDLYDSGEVTSPADLAGKKIALNNPRGATEYLLSEVLKRGNLTLADIELVILPFPDMLVAFANQAIDAGILTEPLASRAVGEGDAVVLIGGDAIVENMQISVMYFGKRLLEPANREAGVRYLMGHLKGVREVYGDGWKKAEVAEIVSKYSNVPVPVVQTSIKPYSEPNGAINETVIINLQEYYLAQDYLDYQEVIPLSEITDLSFLEETLERIGVFEEKPNSDLD
jgi:NitT/TauT family transport system substrate-binding protein